MKSVCCACNKADQESPYGARNELLCFCRAVVRTAVRTLPLGLARSPQCLFVLSLFRIGLNVLQVRAFYGGHKTTRSSSSSSLSNKADVWHCNAAAWQCTQNMVADVWLFILPQGYVVQHNDHNPQALQAWDTALRLLGEVKAHAAAHPDQLDIPEGLSNNLDSTTGLLSTAKQSSPVAAWRQMLKKKVSTLGLLSATEDSLTHSVHHMAAVLKSPPLLACLD